MIGSAALVALLSAEKVNSVHQRHDAQCQKGDASLDDDGKNLPVPLDADPVGLLGKRFAGRH